MNSLVAEEGKHTGYPECPRHPSFEVSRELALTLTAQGDPAAHPGARLASRVQGARVAGSLPLMSSEDASFRVRLCLAPELPIARRFQHPMWNTECTKSSGDTKSHKVLSFLRRTGRGKP